MHSGTANCNLLVLSSVTSHNGRRVNITNIFYLSILCREPHSHIDSQTSHRGSAGVSCESNAIVLFISPMVRIPLVSFTLMITSLLCSCYCWICAWIRELGCCLVLPMQNLFPPRCPHTGQRPHPSYSSMTPAVSSLETSQASRGRLHPLQGHCIYHVSENSQRATEETMLEL